MQTLDAKSHFLIISDDVTKSQLLEVVNSRLCRTAMTFTLAQMVEEGATKESLAGAMRFRDLLLNLAEPKPKPATFPEKQLSVLG